MIELLQIGPDDARLGRLLQLYMHEWSGLIPVALPEDALFVYPELPDWNDREAHAAYLFHWGGDGEARALVGFALTERDAAGCWHVEELFVIAGVRRRGLGADAARALFAARPGPWTLTVRPENPGALAFWRRIVPEAEVRVEPGPDGITRTRLSFVAP